MGKLGWLYVIVAMFALGAFCYASKTGWSPGTAQKERMPQDVIQSKEGYRSFNYWQVRRYGGYRGGK